MKTQKLILYFLLLFISSNVLNAQSKKDLKKQERLAEYALTKKLVQNGQFVFMTAWVVTNKGERLEARGEGLLIEGDESYANLPFVGDVNRSFIGGKDENKIQFKTTETVFDAKYNDKKRKIFIKFEADSKAESYNVFLTIMGNGSATLKISSSSRGQMTYEGHIEKVVIEKNK